MNADNNTIKQREKKIYKKLTQDRKLKGKDKEKCENRIK